MTDSWASLVRLVHRAASFSPAAFLMFTLGCAQGNPFTSQRSTVGSLKANVSQLQYENNKVKSQLAKLEAENQRLDERLSQEEQANGRLTAELDQARNTLAQDGRDMTPSIEVPSPRRTLPANQPDRPAPFARIPSSSSVELDAPIDISPAAPRTSRKFNDDDLPVDLPSMGGVSQDPDAQSWRDSRNWLPVARGVSQPGSNSSGTIVR